MLGRGMLAAGALTLAMGSGGEAQAQASPAPGVTTGELARLCAAGGSADHAGGAALGYCRGFMVGAGQYHAAIAARGTPVFCLPDPSPTMEAAQQSFVGWAQANPQLAGEKAVDGLLRWAAATYPCAARRPARASR